MRRMALTVGVVVGSLLGAVVGARADDIPIFGSGVGADGKVLAAGNNDPHFSIVQTPTGAIAATPAKVASAHPAYVQNNAVGTVGTSWIAPTSSTDAFYAPGTYVYRTTFDMTGLDVSTASLVMRFAVDNTVSDTRLNGVSLGIAGGTFNAFTRDFTVTRGIADGVNTLDFVVQNLGGSANPSGFRVFLAGTAAPSVIPDTTPPVITGVADHTFEAQGTAILLDASALGIAATDDVDGAVTVVLSPSSVSGLGSHTVTATATDAAGNSATASFTATLVDTVAPSIDSLGVTLTPVTGGGRYRCTSTVQAVVNAVVTDANDPAPSVRIVSVESADEVRTCGWHRFAPEFTITGDLSVDFRSNYFSRWFGRTYVITVEASDASGNTTTASIAAVVGQDTHRDASFGRDSHRDDDDDGDDHQSRGRSSCRR